MEIANLTRSHTDVYSVFFCRGERRQKAKKIYAKCAAISLATRDFGSTLSIRHTIPIPKRPDL